MAPKKKKLTEYEQRRLENVRRNEEMMAALKLQSRAAELSNAGKRQKDEATASTVNREKKPKTEPPAITRRSLRSRGLAPELKGLNDDDSESPVAVSESPKDDPKASPKNAGPISMEDVYRGLGSDSAFRKVIRSFPTSTGVGPSSLRRSARVKSQKVENLCDSAVGLGEKSSNANVKGGNDDRDSVDVGNLRVRGDEIVMVEEFDEVKGRKQEHYFDSMLGANENSPSNPNMKREDGDKPSGSTIMKGKGIAKEEMDVLEGCKEEKFCDINPNLSENKPLGHEIKCKNDDEALVDVNCMTLNEKNIARVVPGGVFSIKFFPTPSMRMITVGDKLGYVGFWNMESSDDENGVFLYQIHPGSVSGISIPEFNLSKSFLEIHLGQGERVVAKGSDEMFTCCYGGFLRMMDIEKEIFDLVYKADQSIFSLCQQPNNASCLYFSEGQGELNLRDERTKRSSASWKLHQERINSIDFSPNDPNIMAISSSDGTVSIWDLRNIGSSRVKNMGIVDHKKAVHSAYFSLSGSYLATSSFDNSVGIVSGPNFEGTLTMCHNNQTSNGWFSKAIWGWDDAYIFTGTKKGAVDIISRTRKSIIRSLESPDLPAVPCRFAAHPFKVGTLAAATGGGQVFTWTSQ